MRTIIHTVCIRPSFPVPCPSFLYILTLGRKQGLHGTYCMGDSAHALQITHNLGNRTTKSFTSNFVPCYSWLNGVDWVPWNYGFSCVGLEDLTLKPKQEEALIHLYDGHDVFAWFPTGCGSPQAVVPHKLWQVFMLLMQRKLQLHIGTRLKALHSGGALCTYVCYGKGKPSRYHSHLLLRGYPNPLMFAAFDLCFSVVEGFVYI